jgi:hypothetical protein
MMKWLPTLAAAWTWSALDEKRWPMYPAWKMKRKILEDG